MIYVNLFIKAKEQYLISFSKKRNSDEYGIKYKILVQDLV